MNNPTTINIKLTPMYHRGNQQIKIDFPYDKELIATVKKIDGAKWSQRHRCWYVLNHPDNLKKIYRIFKGKGWVDSSTLFYKKENKPVIKLRPEKQRKFEKEFDNEVKSKILKFKYWMKNKRYSESTVATYINLLEVFFTYFNYKKIHKVTNNDIIRFNNEFILKKGYSNSYQRQMINAIKLFYKKEHEKEIVIEDLERPDKEKKLPNVLAKEEVSQIIRSIKNIKHKTVISLIYSAGLRISEAINLKISDIDSDRMVLHIRAAKGKKDRYVKLSDKVLGLLRAYYKRYKPKTYLFEGQGKDRYSSRSIGMVLKRAVKHAKIKKHITVHTLRHSYATHLHESGTDIVHIQKLLGHNSSKTTEIYTHISNKSLENIKSPLDSLEI
ncbi:tyrosine-type recombinase/integrase [Candidatus Amoebophilus asiaticus]|nr:tyrosine-type recombinase/integrase [Candidatus Amoebophilus asiaticus]